jgi:hypothetical protein
MFRRLLPFASDLWTQRELLWQFTLRNVELRPWKACGAPRQRFVFITVESPANQTKPLS